MELPQQLRDPKFRVTRVRMTGTGSAKFKAPIDTDYYNTGNYVYTDKKFSDWIAQGNNFGICTGYGDLIVIDCDDHEGTGVNPLADAVEAGLPKTFKVKTGSGGYHYYFYCHEYINSLSLDLNGKAVGEIKAKRGNSHIVGPGSLHKSGNRYIVVNDIDMATVTRDDLLKALDGFKVDLDRKTPNICVSDGNNVACGVNIKDVLLPTDYVAHKEELQGGHPIHGSDGGTNFSINPVKNVWHCFRHDTGGGVLEAIAMKEGLLKCEEAVNGGLKNSKFKKVMKIAKEKYGYKENKPVKDEKITESSMIVKDGTLYEEIYNPETLEYAFCYVNDGSPKFTASIDGIAPIVGKEVIDDVVVLPTSPIDYGTVEELILEIKTFIHKYLDVGDEFENICAYYIILSWLYDKVDTIGYLRALGDTGVGKSRFLDVIGFLCYKPICTSGTISPAALFRLEEKWQGTLLLDEADRKNTDTTDEVVKILNCGFEKGKAVVRCNKDDPSKIETFKVYGPKVITSRKTFYDKALEARCFTHIMEETDRDDIIPILGKHFKSEQALLRNKLLMFRLKNYPQDVEKMSDFSCLKGVEPRLKQLVVGLLETFEDESVKNMIIKFVRDYMDKLVEERSTTREGEIVNAIYTLKAMEGLEIITSARVAEELGNDKIGARTVGKYIKSLGMKTEMTRVDGKVKRIITIKPKLWHKLVRRYVPRAILEETKVDFSQVQQVL